MRLQFVSSFSCPYVVVWPRMPSVSPCCPPCCSHPRASLPTALTNMLLRCKRSSSAILMHLPSLLLSLLLLTP